MRLTSVLDEMRNDGMSAEEILQELEAFAKMYEVREDCHESDENERFSEKKIVAFFKRLGMPPHLSGYYYWIAAIKLYHQNQNLKMVNGIYAIVAKQFGKTAPQVERSMRHAVESTWSRGDWRFQKQFMGNQISRDKGKPSSMEFLAGVHEYLKYHQ